MGVIDDFRRSAAIERAVQLHQVFRAEYVGGLSGPAWSSWVV